MQSQTRQINAAGLRLIKSFESLRLKAYRDSVGVLTIGYGHTRDVRPGQSVTTPEAESLLASDLAEFCAGVERLTHGALSDNEFAACVSLAFNIGLGNFSKSSVLRFVNAGDTVRAARAFALWNKAGGKSLAGLARRRAAEAALFRTADNSRPSPGVAMTAATTDTHTQALTPAHAQANSGPATAISDDESSLLDSIPVTDETRAVAGSVLKRLGVRAGVGLSALWGAGVHGHLLVIALLAGAILLLYVERKRLAPVARKVIGKVFAK